MFIHEAVKTAMESSACIARKNYAYSYKILPFSRDTCLLIVKGRPLCGHWMPKAEELMADDWIVVTTEEWPETPHDD